MAKKRTYGKNALGHGIELTGIDEYLKKIQNIGGNIDNVVMEAINESVKPIEKSMIEGAMRHKDNGDVVNSIEAQAAVRDGNIISAKVGIDLQKHPDGFHAVYQEYGGHQDKSFPDPFIRPAFDLNKNKVKSIQRKILKKAGIPMDK
jgi:HK97 gp10 family phage protein